MKTEEAQESTVSQHGFGFLDYPPLWLLASYLEDVEGIRKAIENRTRQALRPAGVPDEDGHARGLGLDEEERTVVLLQQQLEKIHDLEAELVKGLEKEMRQHPLGAWQKTTIGVGAKQLARLLCEIGDPYWQSAEDRPRSVRELWAYCGLAPGQKRKKGQQSNWSTRAKTRAYLIAESCCKAKNSPYRLVYEERREATADRIHAVDCPQCLHAKPGDPWRPGHQHADALRVASKTMLKDLWNEAKRLHSLQ